METAIFGSEEYTKHDYQHDDTKVKWAVDEYLDANAHFQHNFSLSDCVMGQQSQRASTIYCFILCSMANHSDQTFVSPVFYQSDISSYLACYSVTECVLTSHRMLRQKCITSITRKSNLGIKSRRTKVPKNSCSWLWVWRM